MHSAGETFLSYWNWQVTLDTCVSPPTHPFDWYSNCLTSQALLAWSSWWKHVWLTQLMTHRLQCAGRASQVLYPSRSLFQSSVARDKTPGKLDLSYFSMTCPLVLASKNQKLQQTETKRTVLGASGSPRAEIPGSKHLKRWFKVLWMSHT